MLKSLPPWGKVLNKVKRMRGKCAAATRERVVLGGLALISQRAGPLTASPEGEAFLLCEKSVLHGVEDGGTACGKVHVMKRFCFQLGLTRQSTARPTPAPAVRPANRLPKLMAPCT